MCVVSTQLTTSLLVSSVRVLSARCPSGSCLTSLIFSSLTSFTSSCAIACSFRFSCFTDTSGNFDMLEPFSCLWLLTTGVLTLKSSFWFMESGLGICFGEDVFLSHKAVLTICSALRAISASKMGGVWSGSRNCWTRFSLSLLGCNGEKSKWSQKGEEHLHKIKTQSNYSKLRN